MEKHSSEQNHPIVLNGIVTIVNYSSFDNLFDFYFDPVIIVYRW